MNSKYYVLSLEKRQAQGISCSNQPDLAQLNKGDMELKSLI